MGIRKNYKNPETNEVIWCKKEEKPDGWVEIPHYKKVLELAQRISKEELFRYYVLENNNFISTAEYFNIEPEGILHSLLRYYNINKPRKLISQGRKTTGRSHENYVEGGKKSSTTQKENWENKSEQEKANWSEKQKIAHSTAEFRSNISQINKDYQKYIKENNPELYTDRNRRRSEKCKEVWSDPELLKQQHDKRNENRKLRKGVLCRTLAEQKAYDALSTIYQDIEYDIKVDGRYPFFVDFYIPSLDLFIELNGYPSHGDHPYSGDITECYNLYGDWLKTFSITDPQKLQIAKNNNLNYIVIYPSNSLENNLKFNNNIYKDIITLIYNSQKKFH